VLAMEQMLTQLGL